MKCPQYDFENESEKKFCTECGEKLALRCPECKAELKGIEKFCGECGHNLTPSSGLPPKDLSFEEKIAKIQRYLPEGLTEKILSQRERIEGERKQVTVMFCDMEGFTALTPLRKSDSNLQGNQSRKRPGPRLFRHGPLPQAARKYGAGPEVSDRCSGDLRAARHAYRAG
jgi:hypothetical protein